MPEHIRKDMAMHTACIAGASLIPDLESMMRKAGFGSIRITPKYDNRDFIKDWAPGSRIEDYVVSATIEAVKPEA
jgi:arsenite methyltransferase